MKDAWSEKHGKQLTSLVVVVSFRLEPLNLDDCHVVQESSFVQIVSRTEIDFLFVDHDEDLPCLSIDADPSVA